MFVHFRKRISKKMLGRVNDLITKKALSEDPNHQRKKVLTEKVMARALPIQRTKAS